MNDQEDRTMATAAVKPKMPAGVDLDRPVGKKEISDLCGVQPRTVHVWRDRGLLPEPDWESVNGSHAWKVRTILMWAMQQGRADHLSHDHRMAAEALVNGWSN